MFRKEDGVERGAKKEKRIGSVSQREAWKKRL